MASPIVSCPACGAKNRVPVASTGSPRCAKCHADLPWIVDAGDDRFDAAVTSNRLVLVDLWAPWCGPCRIVAPMLDTLARHFAGRLKIVKVNVDSSPAVAQRYRAASIPMLVLLRNGQVVDQLVGAHPERVLREHVTSALGPDGT